MGEVKNRSFALKTKTLPLRRCTNWFEENILLQHVAFNLERINWRLYYLFIHFHVVYVSHLQEHNNTGTVSSSAKAGDLSYSIQWPNCKARPRIHIPKAPSFEEPNRRCCARPEFVHLWNLGGQRVFHAFYAFGFFGLCSSLWSFSFFWIQTSFKPLSFGYLPCHLHTLEFCAENWATPLSGSRIESFLSERKNPK